MKEKIEALKAKIDSAIQETETGRALYELKLKFQAELKSIMSGMRDLPKEERPVFGKVINEFKEGMEQKFDERAVVVRQKELQKNTRKKKSTSRCPAENTRRALCIPSRS